MPLSSGSKWHPRLRGGLQRLLAAGVNQAVGEQPAATDLRDAGECAAWRAAAGAGQARNGGPVAAVVVPQLPPVSVPVSSPFCSWSVQLAGQKHWSLESPYQGEELLEATLAPGDLLCWCSGWYHATEVLGVLGSTYFLVTSDHGYNLGQHRLPSCKLNVCIPCRPLARRAGGRIRLPSRAIR